MTRGLVTEKQIDFIKNVYTREVLAYVCYIVSMSPPLGTVPGTRFIASGAGLSAYPTSRHGYVEARERAVSYVKQAPLLRANVHPAQEAHPMFQLLLALHPRLTGGRPY